jgi:hypothetical protein
MSGKAILSVEKDGDTLYINVIPLTGATTERELAWLQGTTSELAAYMEWHPNQCFRMEPGDKMIFKVNYELTYYKGDGYTTDDDEELVFEKAVKLYHRRGAKQSRKALKQYYQTKKRN